MHIHARIKVKLQRGKKYFNIKIYQTCVWITATDIFFSRLFERCNSFLTWNVKIFHCLSITSYEVKFWNVFIFFAINIGLKLRIVFWDWGNPKTGKHQWMNVSLLWLVSMQSCEWCPCSSSFATPYNRIKKKKFAIFCDVIFVHNICGIPFAAAVWQFFACRNSLHAIRKLLILADSCLLLLQVVFC